MGKNQFPHLPNRIAGLGDLAENLWWSWHPSARMLFKSLDRRTWKESGHNPDKVLKQIPIELLESAATNTDFIRDYDLVMDRFREELGRRECDLLRDVYLPDDRSIAYFSAEYGLHHSLPFYAGGLGFLAGDFLKECSDLSIPLIAVGFMYLQGYFRQKIREDGWQESHVEHFDREAASISRVFQPNGQELVVTVPLIDPPIFVKVWKIEVGRIPLYLLDTDHELNDPWNRIISSHLYVGDVEQRLRQEIVLGIGGSEVLESLGIRHSVLHLNEGHPAFAILERIRDRVNAGADFDRAARDIRDTTIFTTHTPVPAGHDVFPFHLIEKYFGSYWPDLGLDRDSFLSLGLHPEEPGAGFNMTALSLRMSGYRNAVSRKHLEVARKMWRNLWPSMPEDAIPIEYVTNGVHVPTWIEPKMELLFNKYLGTDWLLKHEDARCWHAVLDIPDDELWKTHCWLKMKLFNVIRERSRGRWAEDKGNPSIILTGGTMLTPSVLTVGFARRFAAYKRSDLIFYDYERLKRLVSDPWKPVQFVFAGKAHPADDQGKRILQRVYNAARDPELGGRIAFLEDYGEQFAQYMVHGVDVWLNNPIPPMEACGTSGMKAALNGVPNLSIMDGWWAEGFNGKNGWSFGEDTPSEDRDKKDAEAVYEILERQVVPMFYDTSEDGIPHNWVKIMKESITSTFPKFSSRRMARDYVGHLYGNALKTALFF
ncbi:MAG: alpha-glucan family phosphorylase [Deltaproteobacteria bacterium]|nr:alpha-glucan family phosphorylase [Deltaproteobacteria bacterium]